MKYQFSIHYDVIRDTHDLLTALANILHDIHEDLQPSSLSIYPVPEPEEPTVAE